MFGIDIAASPVYLGGIVSGVLMAAFTIALLNIFGIRSFEDMRSKSMVGVLLGVVMLIGFYSFIEIKSYVGVHSFFFMLGIAYIILLGFFLKNQDGSVDQGRTEGVKATKSQLESLFDVGVVKGDKESVFEALPDDARDVKHWKEQQSKEDAESESEQMQETLEDFEE